MTKDAKQESELRTQTLARLEELSSRGFECASCGKTHFGLMDLVISNPVGWPSELARDKFHNDGDFHLNDDFCVMNGTDFYVRGNLRLPIKNGDGRSFGYGVWSSLSKESFKIYLDTIEDDQRDHLSPWFGWFSSKLNGYPETLHLKLHVKPQNDKIRPLFELEPTDHPLAVEQREGIDFDRLLEIFRLNSHEIKI